MNLLKSIIRSFYRFKYYTLVNLFGLILGLTCSIVLFLYVSFQFSYDQFHADKDRIFRVSEVSTSPQKKEMVPLVRIPVAPDLKDAFAEIEDYTRIKLSNQGKLLKLGDKSISFKNSLYSDANFFRFFSFGLKLGDPETVLTDKNSIVLTDEIATKLFGDQNPVGATITCNNQPFVVSGIANNAPLNSHIFFDVVFPLEPLLTTPGIYLAWNGGMSATTFFKMQRAGQEVDLAKKLPDFLWEKVNKAEKESGFSTDLVLEPITRIHLYSKVDWDMFRNKSYTNVMILFFIGMLVLIIAFINYLFISNGTLALRSKEFGIKQYLGIGKFGVINQLFAESLLLFFTSGGIAILILWILHPVITKLFGIEFIAHQLPRSLPFIIFILMVFSALSSLIQYIIFRRNKSVLRHSAANSSLFRNRKIAYVSAFQFCISIALIASMLIVYKQLNFALHKDIGFKAGNIINVMNGAIGTKGETLITELKKLPGVINASASFGIPGLETTQNGYKPEGDDQWQMYAALHVDDQFFKTFQVNLLSGRNFREGRDVDNQSFIINETLAKQLGWDDPLGKTIFRDENHEIIGVVKDFQVSTIYTKIPPLIISKQYQDQFYTLSIALSPDNLQQTLKKAENIWNKVIPNTPFNYFFLDARLETMYADVQQTVNILLIFTGISILISVLGLFGITFLLLNSRVKEIGIRKINGAKVSEVITMLNKDFVKWVVIAFVIATPIAWYAMNKWLESFAYKTELSWWIFALAGLLALGIALLTVSFQTYKAASKNPIESLRYE
jgi:putative ABC transport system permease protein